VRREDRLMGKTHFRLAKNKYISLRGISGVRNGLFTDNSGVAVF
jgi:hypothetical protein